jgi:serine/threonine protein kinase
MRVFISSTSQDLASYRQAARDVVLDLGWQPVMMEHFWTEGRCGIVAACLERLGEAEVVVAIIGWQRGSVPTAERGGDGRRSYTQLELEAALTLGKPVLAFLARDTWPGGLWESAPDARVAVEALRAGLDRLAVLFDWETPDATTREPMPMFRAKVRQELLRFKEKQLVAGCAARQEERSPLPLPHYPNEETRALAAALEKAYDRYGEQMSSGQDTTVALQEILELRREMREGGRLKAGDFLMTGRFRLLEPIGTGGFATVWRAYDRRMRSMVAVKVLHGQFAEDRTRRERFSRGARKMAELQHQGIARVVEQAQEEGGYHFFVMELTSGGDLRRATLEGRFATEVALSLLIKVGDALQFAHQHRVIHRDIKPSNILLADGRYPKLTDFDLVRAFDTTGGTLGGGALGSVFYTAPEAMNGPQEAGITADIYSLGMTAAFCIHGSELPIDVLTSRAAFLRDLSCSKAIKAVVRKAISFDPGTRFRSVADFSAALQEAVASPSRVGNQTREEKETGRFRISMGKLLVPDLRSGRTDVVNLIYMGLERIFALETLTLLVRDSSSGMLIDPRGRDQGLDCTSQLVSLLANSAAPVAVDLTDPASLLSILPERERGWLSRTGLQVLAPITAHDGTLLGVLGLGRKRNGRPFRKEDWQLIREIASSAAVGLELEQRPKQMTTERSDEERVAAKECARCGTLYEPNTVFCGTCDRRLEISHVPFVLPGKFRFEQRIGIGGMGVVYRGTDLALGRPVAVKTLRRVSSEDAMRLRREARTAAAVIQPHLASIYGIESWQGTPMLILELLEGGTLAQRLERERMMPLETVELGICMADALARLHAADILHRDIKPTNIGFTRDGVAKLMDFGIARLMFDLRRDQNLALAEGHLEHSSLLLPTSIWSQTGSSMTVSQQLAGTLSYLSPEALNGQRPDVSFDLWSLAIVLYECLLGRKVFGGTDMRQLMARIRLGRVPDFAQVCPDYDDTLGDFFRKALHRDLIRRHATPQDMREHLTQIHFSLLQSDPPSASIRPVSPLDTE